MDDAVDALIASFAPLAFDDFLDQSFRALILRTPESAISLSGIQVPKELNNISPAYRANTFALSRAIHRQLDNFPRAALSTADKLSYDVYAYYLDDVIASEAFTAFGCPASTFITGVPRQTLDFFTEFHPLNGEQDAQNWGDCSSKLFAQPGLLSTPAFTRAAGHLMRRQHSW